MQRHPLGIRALLAAFVLAVAAPASATYVFNTINYPGGTFTDVRGINNAGHVVGYTSLDGVNNFSFLYAAGGFSPLAPSAISTSALGINDSDVVVGATNTTPEQGFIYSGGTYTFFSRPGWTNTEARAISNSGLVVGWSFETDAGGGTTSSSGFIYNPATSTYTDIPIAGSPFVIAQGINGAGQVVGSALFLTPGGQQGWLRQPAGTISFFQVAASSTHARGINDTGLITGFTTGATNSGFVGTSSGFELLDVPGAASTVGESVNNAGQVAGLWFDAANVSHGFMATPAALPTGTTSGGAYTFSIAVVPNTPIFIDPKVATGYEYRTGRKDPNFAAVQFPIGIGDSMYLLRVGGKKFVVAGGEWFDFREHGFRKGVDDFRVGCIEASAALDPANPQAFPTGLEFVAAGTFTGTQKPLAHKDNGHQPRRCDLDIDDDD
jgi:hypothetical protein